MHNWSFAPSTFKLPAAITELLDDATPALAGGTPLLLGAWDVRVLRVQA